ncbi:efflux transporter outer membrane subunit [Sphingomonas sp. JC676]|uniref:efflux transporter outer membrane subunit n=1 Tax=Sphingomonas sp. JC676 TaxID=2768065 RepID=UPI00165809C0|nr:efflux transporter outer membrane subunit [Sphingomonas sp. JC676]MBC9032476.1 efflux transporter outer membrane subunit [Sphingomonas sp. JC676]
MIRFLPARPRRAALLLALCTSACASVPHLGPMPVARTAPAAAAAQTLAGTGSEWPGEGWWQHYKDPQLSQLIEEALANSPDLDVAAARIRVAEGFTRQAGAALLPTVDAGGSIQEVKLSKNNGVPAQLVPGGWNDTASAGLGISIDLDLWGKNRAALRAAKLDLQAARYDAGEARLALTTGIASAYAELAALYTQHDSLTAAVDIRAQTLQLVAQRVAQGLDTDATLRQARGRLEQTQANLAATDEAIELANNALAALVGSGPDRGRSIGRPMIAALEMQGIPDNASIDLVGRRPDVAAARARADSAAQRIKVARADFYPNINLSALVGFQAVGIDNLFKQGSTFGSAGPAVSLPLFHGGALQGQYRASRGQYDEAIALYDRQVIEALRQTADALTSQKRLVARLTDSRRALADFEEANRLARLRYRQGLSTYLDVLSAEEGVLDSRLNVAKLETRAFALDVTLIRALGGGFHS